MPAKTVKASKPSGRSGATESIEVRIGGRHYRLRGSEPDVLRRLASQVDRTLGELAGPGRHPDDFKLAVLAALNIAGECEETRADWADRAEQLQSRCHGLADRLERLRERIDGIRPD